MGNMSFKVGDRVRIKSLDWYNKNKNKTGDVPCGEYDFVSDMSVFCGKILTIDVDFGNKTYLMKEDNNGFIFTDEMIEGIVEEETKSKEMLKENAKHYWKLINGDSKSKFKVGDKVTLDLYPCVVTAVEWRGDSKYVGYVYTVRGTDFGKKVKETDLVFRDVEEETKPKYEDEVTGEYYSTPKYLVRPNGYQFVDENGNVINATKIVLEKKKKEYPKTYEECCEIVKVEKKHTLEGEIIRKINYKINLLESFQKLLICRDAYWKLYGEEKGLDSPWEPDYDSGVNKYGIICMNGVVQESNPTTNWERHLNKVLDFPTAEMRDAFKENFDPDIEICKELL